MGFYEEFGVSRLINAAGPVTRYGGSVLSPAVLAAMAQATDGFVRLDELQLAAGKRLAEWTGTEAGYVTTGASAAITLGAAAMMAETDPDRMESLPVVGNAPCDFLIQTSHRSDYDCAFRAAGATLVSVDCSSDLSDQELESFLATKCGYQVCATAYVYRTGDRGVSLDRWVKASHELGLPVLVDASVRLPPVSNLRAIPATGADLVAFSGGKAIQGPQGSGFLVGREALIKSVLLQNQDLDVNEETWSLRSWLGGKGLDRIPSNGIGRGYKVSKETIVGLLKAIEEYQARDPEQDKVRWGATLDRIASGLGSSSKVSFNIEVGSDAGYPVPMGILTLPAEGPLSLVEFVNLCATGDPPVVFEEGPLAEGYLVVHPMCLSLEEADILVERVRSVLG